MLSIAGTETGIAVGAGCCRPHPQHPTRYDEFHEPGSLSAAAPRPICSCLLRGALIGHDHVDRHQ